MHDIVVYIRSNYVRVKVKKRFAEIPLGHVAVMGLAAVWCSTHSVDKLRLASLCRSWFFDCGSNLMVAVGETLHLVYLFAGVTCGGVISASNKIPSSTWTPRHPIV